MIVSRGMGVVGKGPGLAQNALFHFPLGYDVRGEDHGLTVALCATGRSGLRAASGALPDSHDPHRVFERTRSAVVRH